MTVQRITATYRIETAYPIREAVETMAGEQSTGTFVRVPGETEELRRRFPGRGSSGSASWRRPINRACPGPGPPRGLEEQYDPV